MKKSVLQTASLAFVLAMGRFSSGCADSSAGNADSDAVDGGASDGSPFEGGFPVEAGPGPFCDGAPCAGPKSCAEADFCEVEVGLDPRHALFTVRGTSKNDVWTAGAAGTLLHYDGTTWTKLPTGRQESFYGLWPAGADDLWLTSSGRLILHMTREDGAAPTFTEASISDQSAYNGPYRAVLASPDGATLVVAGAFFNGLDGQIGELWSRGLPDGTTWTSKARGGSWRRLNGLWSDGAALWRVGNRGVVERATDFWTNPSPPWLEFDGQTSGEITAVTGFDDGSVWLVGVEGIVRRYRGEPSRRFEVLEVPTRENLNAIWGTGPTNLWVVGSAGTILHCDGATWTQKSIFHKGSQAPELHAIWGTSADDVWVVGRGVVLRIHERETTPGGTQ